MKAGWKWAAAAMVTGAMWAGCAPTAQVNDQSEQDNPGLDSPREEPAQPDKPLPIPNPDPGDGGTGDGGTGDGGTGDGGTGDGGTKPPPVTQPPEAEIVFPTTPGWQFYGTQHGGPRRIYGVSADEGGNVWVAGGEDGLFVLTRGATTLRRYTMADGLHPYGYMADGSDTPGEKYLKAISVAGGPAGTVFVGYEGRPGSGADHCENNWDGPRPDPSRYKSGDADKVTLNADGSISVVHYDIFSGPNVVSAEMRGREKLCNILRIVYDKNTQSVWFGGNHGFARGDATFQGNHTCNGQLSCTGVFEHVHPAINAQDNNGNSILLTDAYYGVAVHSSGDAFFGGANRSTRFRYGSNGLNYWRSQSESEDKSYAWNRFDIWADKVQEPSSPKPADRVDDNVSGMAVLGDTVWVSSFTRGLARMNAQGGDVQYVNVGETALSTVAADPSGEGVWTGARWLGVVYRIQNGVQRTYSCTEFGRQLCGNRISDIQVDTSSPTRRVLVGFMGSDETHVPGALGIYTGN